MNNTEKLVKIIQEVVRKEIRSALKEELSKQKQVAENYNPTVNSIKTVKKSKPTGNTIQDLLNETKESGDWRTLGGGTFDSGQAINFGWQQQMLEEHNGGTVNNIENFIQANNNGAQDIRQVQVNAVPDFSNMMKTMKTKGMI